MEKYYDPAYWTLVVISMINWLLTAVDLGSKLAALGISIITILYLYKKLQGQILDNKLKKKELEETDKQ